jgi:hypothetical protein
MTHVNQPKALVTRVGYDKQHSCDCREKRIVGKYTIGRSVGERGRCGRNKSSGRFPVNSV